MSVQCNFGFHGQIVNAGAFRDIWKFKRRSYSASLQRQTNHPIVLFCKKKKKMAVPEGVHSIFPRLQQVMMKIVSCSQKKKYLANTIEVYNSVLISSVLCYVVQTLHGKCARGANVTAQHWNSWAPRYTCLRA